jgi:hypothetical protein
MLFLRGMFNKLIIMKKLFLTLSIVATLAFTSCDNDNAVNPQPLGKATITGTVYADFDETDDTDDEDVVANKKIVIEIYDGYTDTSRFTETTTDANGNYTIEVELGNRSLHVFLDLVDFRADVKTADGTESVIFTGSAFGDDVTISKGGEYILDLIY